MVTPGGSAQPGRLAVPRPAEASAPPRRRRGKEWRERLLAALALVPTAPVLLLVAAAIKVEGLVDPDARGPVFFAEQRISRGRVIHLLKFRTLTAAALAQLGDGPTHIKHFERAGMVTRVGAVLKAWYLDELPQVVNIVRGDMYLIGTRPYPLDAYADELARGVTRKRDMPAGLIGSVQSYKGVKSAGELQLDEEYWEAFLTWSWWRLLQLDIDIVRRSLGVQLAHKGR